MAKKPTYEELEQRIKALEEETAECKQAEEALRRSEEQYKTVANSSLTGIFIHQAGRYMFVNERFAKMHGYTKEELLGKEYKTLIHPDDRAAVTERVSKRLKGEPAPSHYEVKRLRKDGTIIWCEMIATAIQYRGTPAAMGNVMDISQRKQAEKALEESEEMARALLNATTDAVVLLDARGVILDVNETYANRFEKSKDEMLGLCIWYLLPPGLTEARMVNVKKVFETGKPVRMLDERREVWNDTNIYPVRNARGEVKRVAVFVRDVTARKRAEEHIHILTQQLMQAQENERQRIARDLHDNVAQDLSLLKIGYETLFDGQLSTPVEITQKTSELSEILQRSITSVRNMAYDLCPPGLDQLGLVRTVYQYCEEFSATNKINIDFSAAGLDLIKLPSDTEINLYRLIQEALWNISKHANASRVVIRMVASFPSIILRIEDDGIGFNVKNRMIEAFAEKRMGLRSMQERVSLLEGKMRIKSRAKEGTKIVIEVPYKERDSG